MQHAFVDRLRPVLGRADDQVQLAFHLGLRIPPLLRHDLVSLLARRDPHVLGLLRRPRQARQRFPQAKRAIQLRLRLCDGFGVAGRQRLGVGIPPAIHQCLVGVRGPLPGFGLLGFHHAKEPARGVLPKALAGFGAQLARQALDHLVNIGPGRLLEPLRVQLELLGHVDQRQFALVQNLHADGSAGSGVMGLQERPGERREQPQLGLTRCSYDCRPDVLFWFTPCGFWLLLCGWRGRENGVGLL